MRYCFQVLMYYWLTKHLTIYIFFTDMRCLEKPKHWIQCWKRQNPEFQCLEKPKFTILMFGKAKTLNSNVEKAKIQNSNVWISENTEVQCLRNAEHWISIFVKSQNPEFPAMFGKRKPLISNVWKKLTQSGKSNVWKR